MKSFTIGQVAKHAGVGVETVRFYERKGLLDEQVVDRIRFIRRAKELGFTLKEIKELLELRLDPTTTCADVKRRAEAKIEVDEPQKTSGDADSQKPAQEHSLSSSRSVRTAPPGGAVTLNEVSCFVPSWAIHTRTGSISSA